MEGQVRDKIFISYSHKDKEWLERIQLHLKPYFPSQDIVIWADTKIGTGTLWREEIENALATAKVAILLVSPAFLASNFIISCELPLIIDAAKQKELTFIWIAIASSGYKETEFVNYQAANDPERPLNSLSRAQQDKELVKICERVKEVFLQSGTQSTTSAIWADSKSLGHRKGLSGIWRRSIAVTGLLVFMLLLGCLILFNRFRSDNIFPPTANYSFEVVKVDSKGNVVETRPGRAHYFSEDLGDGIVLEMVEIPSGSFDMGTADSDIANVEAELKKYEPTADHDFYSKQARFETPLHKVELPRYFISKFEITQAQWRIIAGWQPVSRDLTSVRVDPSHVGDNIPIENVSWWEAVEFCERLERLTGRPYRLPSEAEWEYACRAGTSTPFHFGGNVTPNLVNYDSSRQYGSTAQISSKEKPRPVGSFSRGANAFGLFDMHGNVEEWCADLWHENYIRAPGNGEAWKESGDPIRRVVRGGSWWRKAAEIRSAHRENELADAKRNYLGFRVALRLTANK